MADTDESIPSVVPAATDDAKRNQDDRGRFLPGNKAGKDKYFQRRQAQYRRAFHEALDNDEMRALARCMYQIALTGDVQAARFVADYTLGRVVDAGPDDESTKEETGSITINLVQPTIKTA